MSSLSSCCCGPCIWCLPKSSNLFKSPLCTSDTAPPLPPRPNKTSRRPSTADNVSKNGSEIYLNLISRSKGAFIANSHAANNNKPQYHHQQQQAINLGGDDSDYWSLDQVNNSANWYASSRFSAFNYDDRDVVEAYDLLPPLPSAAPPSTKNKYQNYNTLRYPRRHTWNLGRSRSNSDLRAPPRQAPGAPPVTAAIKTNAQTQTQTENNGSSLEAHTSMENGNNNGIDEALARQRNAATAAWLARDRTPDSTPPQLTFTVNESPLLNSRSNSLQDSSSIPYATIRRNSNNQSPIVTNSSSTQAQMQMMSTSNGSRARGNAVGWKHASPVDDYIELFEPDVEIDRNRLEIGLLIGEGQFGDVFEGEYRPNGKDGQCIPVAVKMCKSGSDEALGDFLEEACLFRQLAHPYIIALIGVSTSTDPLLILTELAPLGPLRDFLSKERDRLHLNLVNLLTFSAQTASALAYLHSRRLIHRDVAARNVLVFSREPILGKLSDFGLARRLPPDAETYTATGGRLPVKWLAPESVNFRKFSRATDVWMLGVFLWEVTTFGSRPWQNVRNADYPMLLAVGARLPRPEPSGAGQGSIATCPPSLYSLMLSCWADQPSGRPGCDQIFSQLLAIREEALASQRLNFYQTSMPPPKPPMAEPQQQQHHPPKSSSSSLALEQATLWLLDSVATLAPPGPLSPALNSSAASGTSTNGASVTASSGMTGFASSLESGSQTRLGMVDLRQPFSALLGHHQQPQQKPAVLPKPTIRPHQDGQQFIVPVVAAQNPSPMKTMSNGNSNNALNLSSIADSLASSGDLIGTNQLYDQTLTVVRCVFTLNKELERVGSESPPSLLRILDLASAVCTAGRNLLTCASSVNPMSPVKNNNSEPSSLALLRANLGAHIRSVLAALRPLSSVPTGQQMMPPPLQNCRQLAEAAAGVAVAARLLLARSLVPENAGQFPTSLIQSNNDLNDRGFAEVGGK